MAQGIVVTPEQLAALKGVFTTESTTVTDLTARIAGQLGNTQWEGHVADTFRSDWAASYAPVLNRLAESLQQASADIESALQRALAADGQA
jgi:uncharacterized protein YukE